MLFDEEKTDFDDIATAGETKEIERAEKKAARKASKEAKKREKLLRDAAKLGFTPEMLGEDFGNEMSFEEILASDKKEKAQGKDGSSESSDNASESVAAEGTSIDKRDDDSSKVESDDTSKKKRKKGRKERDPSYNVVKELLSTIIYMGGVILLVFILHTFVGQKVQVEGDSMNPTLLDTETLWVDKLRYHFTDPKRFDVIVFPWKPGGDILFVKRIIGLPGETVKIENGNIYINGQVLNEDYGAAAIEDPGIASTKVILASDEYFVLGDNRNNSNDSRSSDVGNIKRENIIGKAVFRITPLKKFGDFDKEESE